MFKTILVPTTGNGGDRSALDTAFLIGRLFDSHIECLHIRPTIEQMIVSAADGDGFAGDALAGAVSGTFEALKAQDEARAEEIRNTVQWFCRERPILFAATPPGPRGVSFALHEVRGEEIEQTIKAASYHDLVVLGRPTGGSGMSVGDMGTVLVGCGRPVVLASSPAPENLAPTIAIAWKQTPEAARAVSVAMPLLRKAERIIVLAASEDAEKAGAALESAEHLADQLRWHGFAVEARRVVLGERTLADAVIETATGVGADLLVMGAYGHSRVRELVFGGLTRHVLHACPIPVLLFH